MLGQFSVFALGLALRTLQAIGGFAVETHLLLDARDLGADLVDLGLHLVQMIGGIGVTLAHRFHLRLVMALAGNVLLDLDLGRGQARAFLVVLALEAAVFERAQLGFLARLLVLQSLPALGGAGLPVQMFELLVHFVAHVAHAVEVFAGGLDAALGFLAALLVLGDAGGFFQMRAQFVGRGLDDLADHALLDDRVAARTQAGAEEQIGDVAAAAARAVEEVRRLTVAGDLALHRNLGVLPVFALDGAVGVVEDQLDRGLAHRLARVGTGKDHVGERVAAQTAGRAFAHHPADGVDDVGLAATIGTDHAGHIGRQMQGRRVHEGLEAGEFDRSQAHAGIGGKSG